MYLHPIFVHFPIALLTVYAILECIRFRKVMEKPYWFYVKAMLAMAGFLGAVVAYATGEEGYGIRILEMHERFATITLIIFGLVALAYLGEWFRPNKLSGWLMKPYIIIVLAVLGLAAVTITGGLGGAMVYGTNFDPFMAPVFKLLGVY